MGTSRVYNFLHAPMYRSIVSRAVRPVGRRNFVSTVLLTRSWETSNVTDLKKELKSRGLASSGNKASLVTRLQEDDKQKTLQAVSTPTQTQTRQASTVVTPEPTAETAPVPGNPDVAQADRPPPAGFMSTILPDLSQPIPEPPVQVPYLPDFWDSSALKAANGKNALEQELPKIVVIAGADTHHGGGPSHNLLDAAQALSPEEALASPKATPTAPVAKGQGGLWDDVAEDLGLPHPKELKSTFANLFRS